MSVTLECMRCQHRFAVEGAEGDPAALLATGVFKCRECGARMSYGELQPRIVVSVQRPHFVTLQIDNGPVHKLDAQYAASLAKNLLSVSVP